MRPICTGFTEASLGSLHALLDEVEAAKQFAVETAKQFDAMSAERPSNGLSSDRNRERRSSTTGSIHGAGEPHAPAEGRSVFGFGKWALLNLPLPGAGNRSGGRSGGQTPRSRERSGRHTPERD